MMENGRWKMENGRWKMEVRKSGFFSHLEIGL